MKTGEASGLFEAPGSPLLRDPRDKRVSSLVSGSIGKVALVGIPWDWSTSGRPGSRYAPQALRSAFYALRTWAPSLKSTITWSITDYGDIRVAPGDWTTTKKRVERALENVYSNDHEFIIILGGDHSITEATVAPLARNERVGLLVLDAHYDLRSVSEGLTSGSWLWSLLRSSKEKVTAAVVGVADYSNPEYLEERAKELGVRIVTRLELREDPSSWKDAVDHLLASGSEVFYISVDMDHIDQSYAPGVNSPTPLGMTPLESLEVLRYSTAKLKPRAVDVVEIVPAADPAGLTVSLAARLLAYTLHTRMGEGDA